MKRLTALGLVCFMVFTLILSGCAQGSKAPEGDKQTAAETTKQESAQEADKPESQFIADRTFTLKFYQAGRQLAQDQENNPIAKKVREITGMTQKTTALRTSDVLQELTIDLASGELPDVMALYWESSSVVRDSQILSVLVKACKEGTFANLRPFLENTKTKYNRFLDEKYLTKDLKENVVLRPDFNGSVYMLQMELPRENVPTTVWIGGMGLYARNDIAKALNVDLSTIKTQEQLYEFAKKIKAGNFKDGNGKNIIPIGPSIWSGFNSTAYYQNYDFGSPSNFGKDSDGAVKHLAMTDYPIKSAEFIRKLMAEGLMDKESLTMPGAKATEAFANASYGIMLMHAFSQSWDGGSDVLWTKNPDKLYLPIGPMENFKGSTVREVTRRGNTLILIPESTKNKEEIFKFMEWSTRPDAKRLMGAGIEGEHYTLIDRVSREYLKYTKEDPDDDGKQTVPTQAVKDAVAADPNYAVNLGLGQNYFGAIDSYLDLAATFGVGDPKVERYDYGRQCLNLAAPEAVITDGLPVGGLLENFPGIEKLKPALDAYNDTFIKACFAKSPEDVKKVIEAYRKQLIDAGVEEAQKYLQDIDSKGSVNVMFYNN